MPYFPGYVFYKVVLQSHVKNPWRLLAVETNEFCDCPEQNPSTISMGCGLQILKAFIYDKNPVYL